jgi:hypothetical protein
MKNFYFDVIAYEYINIHMPENIVNFYFIQTHFNKEEKKYKLCATSKKLEELLFDPETRVIEYWPISFETIIKHINILFKKMNCRLLQMAVKYQALDIPDFKELLSLSEDNDSLVLVNEKLFFVDILQGLVTAIDDSKIEIELLNNIKMKCRHGELANEALLESINKSIDRIPTKLMNTDPMTEEFIKEFLNLDLSQINPLIFNGYIELTKKISNSLSESNIQVRNIGQQLLSAIESSSLGPEQKDKLLMMNYKLIKNPARYATEVTIELDQFFKEACKELAINISIGIGLFLLAYGFQYLFEYILDKHLHPYLYLILPSMLNYYFDKIIALRDYAYSFPVGAIFLRSMIASSRILDSKIANDIFSKVCSNAINIQIAQNFKKIKSALEEQHSLSDQYKDDNPIVFQRRWF